MTPTHVAEGKIRPTQCVIVRPDYSANEEMEGGACIRAIETALCAKSMPIILA